MSLTTVFLIVPSGGEFILVILAVLLLFGSDKIPEFARMVGKGMKEFRKASDEIKREINLETKDIREEVNKSKRAIRNEIDNLKSNVETSLDQPDQDPLFKTNYEISDTDDFAYGDIPPKKKAKATTPDKDQKKPIINDDKASDVS